ncbi:hypothetical protein [Sphingobium yanoikuyae]|uniref:Uncharacterized protein n=1 Tax=Sphingobium yanoikuyae TaxID=13690 RepID=A0A3G2UPM6_SPHYA|nr:hypothetical protein [Sphingobium yanoikuyae]AYO76464.1 hypothetical protein EBF16_05595 [Sphingobium yanoikuyae]
MQNDLAYQVAAILDPKAWDGQERPSERLRVQIRHRQTSSLKRARAVLAVVASHLTIGEETRDA